MFESLKYELLVYLVEMFYFLQGRFMNIKLHLVKKFQRMKGPELGKAQKCG